MHSSDFKTFYRFGQKPNVLDLILTNIEDHISNATVGPAIGSTVKLDKIIK